LIRLKDRLKKLRRSLIWSSGILQELNGYDPALTTFTQKRGNDKGTLLSLALQYREHFEKTHRVLNFDSVEFRNYSQNGEDGILWYVFSLLGTVNKKCIEICAGDGIQCNTANLIINDGWTGLLFEGNPSLVRKGQAFFKTHPDTFAYPPRFCHAWVTAENVNDLVRDNGFIGEIDLLSIDVDGVDFWIWNAIEAIRPRVVVAEIQALWGAEASVTVPYRPDFRAEYISGFGVYCGASLPAFVKLANKKGYRLVGCQRYGYNAFFIRNDVGQNLFPEIPPEQCFLHPFAKWAYAELRPLVLNREWQEI
jgi:hypothetical protein